MQNLILFVLLLTLFTMTSCESVYNLVESEGLKNHVTELFKKYGNTSVEPTCQMIGATRSGFCELRGSDQQIAQTASNLNLQEVVPEKMSDDELLRYQLLAGEKGCAKMSVAGKGKFIKIYKSERRANNLKLINGQAFEYLLLYYNSQSNDVCVQASYSFG